MNFSIKSRHDLCESCSSGVMSQTEEDGVLRRCTYHDRDMPYRIKACSGYSFRYNLNDYESKQLRDKYGKKVALLNQYEATKYGIYL